MQLVSLIISSIILGVTESLLLNEQGNKINSIFKKFVLFLIVVSSLLIGALYIGSYIKPFAIMFVFFMCGIILKKDSIKTSMINAFYIQFLALISDIIFGLVFYMFLSNENVVEWISTSFGVIICNLASSIILIILSSIPFVKKIFERINRTTIFFNRSKFILTIFFSFFVMITLFYAIYYHYYSNHFALYIVIIMMFVFYTVIMFMILFYYNQYKEMRSKYIVSLESLEEYEDMINKYRVMNHENKNQLMLVRNIGSYSKVKEYIDELIKEKNKDKNDIYDKVKKIPKSYLRTVVYTKMSKMEKNTINYELIVDRNVSSKDFLKISTPTMIDLCNIVNVFLDNAIESSLLTKSKMILIEISMEDEIVISISNTFIGTIEVSKISNSGYTTKGKGHGYGLSLVEEMIKKNSNLKHECSISNDIFTQTVKIKP